MPVDYTLEERGGCLRVTVVGNTDSPDELIGCIDAVLADCARIGCGNILFDHRGLRFGREFVGNYDTALRLSRRLSTERPMRVALVSRPERMEFARIYEPIGVGRGAEIKAFDGAPMAVVWLTGGPKTPLD
ncbi:hypothetical protein [Pseudodesulfovibrio sp.]|uniref:hypothetical protein n=1 Tax=Pseudodesulfovibrio sp. TaxID=2035812 RepID=UPI00261D564F|nr:hypothetical protein [Pseudodesulfovibrio sp.]MDD3311136.1 hypothetical protein [Pseudodesulfovibrio sp.]